MAGTMIAVEVGLLGAAALAYSQSHAREPPVDLTRPVVRDGTIDDAVPHAQLDAFPHVALRPGAISDAVGDTVDALAHPFARAEPPSAAAVTAAEGSPPSRSRAGDSADLR